MVEYLAKSYSNPEIVTLAVYILGGKSQNIDTEYIAIKSNELAPGRFVWKKFKDQINKESVRISLADAKKTNKFGYVLGSQKDGWVLSEKGIKYAKSELTKLKDVDISQVTLKKQEIQWQRHEKDRMLSTIAYDKINLNKSSAVTIREAEDFFRLDDYITGKARENKISRIVNIFKNDPDLGKAINILLKKVQSE